MRRRRSGLNFSRQRKKFNLPLFKEILSWAVEIAIVVIIAFVFVSSFGMRVKVVGPAMEPTLKSEEQVLVNKFGYAVFHPKVGDVVVFLPNGNEKSHYYIRRVVAKPGDRVVIRDGALFVNGEIFKTDEELAAMEDAGIASNEITLEQGEYFVLGDNRNNSEDSRFANVGNVKEEYIVGKAWLGFSSIKNIRKVK